MTELRVGFWNIEKGNADFKPDERALRDGQKFIVVQTAVLEWYRRHRFDVLILAEVTESRGNGEQFMRTLATTLNVQISGKPFRSDFVWSFVGPADARKGTCNFGVLWNTKQPSLSHVKKLDLLYEKGWVRPIVVVPAKIPHAGAARAKTLLLCGIHAKAGNPELATREVLGACDEIVGNHDGRGVVIGDMNIRFERAANKTVRTVTGLTMEPVYPGIDPTHRPHSPIFSPAIFDYIWHDPKKTGCAAHPPDSGYNGWNIIDHAPVEYIVQTRF
jgi:hypothetical protein